MKSIEADPIGRKADPIGRIGQDPIGQIEADPIHCHWQSMAINGVSFD